MFKPPRYYNNQIKAYDDKIIYTPRGEYKEACHKSRKYI
jgi:hypothetical protein